MLQNDDDDGGGAGHAELLTHLLMIGWTGILDSKKSIYRLAWKEDG